ncbi:unnamed protein product [Soboliphyme baturini]|uniref:Uncharacterized protein n=1 Tax=Soboliphyme baturini TaxID=241478 RepID=A0A183IL68_9BILA|nr:unnamed protein product [Soboliphyme baturini]
MESARGRRRKTEEKVGKIGRSEEVKRNEKAKKNTDDEKKRRYRCLTRKDQQVKPPRSDTRNPFVAGWYQEYLYVCIGERAAVRPVESWNIPPLATKTKGGFAPDRARLVHSEQALYQQLLGILRFKRF